MSGRESQVAAESLPGTLVIARQCDALLCMRENRRVSVRIGSLRQASGFIQGPPYRFPACYMSSTVLTDVEWQNEDAEDAVLQCILVRVLLGAPASGASTSSASAGGAPGHFVTHAIKQRMVDFIRANIVPPTKRLRERVLICGNEAFASTATLRNLNSIGCAFTDIIRAAWLNTIRWGRDVDAVAIRSRPVTMEAIQRMATRMELISRQPLEDIAALEDGVGGRNLDELRSAAIADDRLTEESLSRRAPAELTREDGVLLSQITGGIRATSILEDDPDGCRDLELPAHIRNPKLSPYVVTPPPSRDSSPRACTNETSHGTRAGLDRRAVGDGCTPHVSHTRSLPDAAEIRTDPASPMAPTIPRMPTISAASLATSYMNAKRGCGGMRMGEMEKDGTLAHDIDSPARVWPSAGGRSGDQPNDYNGAPIGDNGDDGGDDDGDDDDDIDSLFGARMFGLPAISVKTLSDMTTSARS